MGKVVKVGEEQAMGCVSLARRKDVPCLHREAVILEEKDNSRYSILMYDSCFF